jgi:hypothetical protein
MIENNKTIEAGFLNFYKQLRKQNFANKNFVKKYVVNEALDEFNAFFAGISNINWDSDAKVDEAYDNAAIAIYNINYILLPQMIMCEYAENYEDAKTIFDIAYQTYYAIAEYTSPTFDINEQPKIIKQDIAEAVYEIKQAIITIEENLNK